MFNSTTKLLLTIVLGIILGWQLHLRFSINNEQSVAPIVKAQEFQTQELHEDPKPDEVGIVRPTEKSVARSVVAPEKPDLNTDSEVNDAQSIVDYLLGFEGSDYERYSAARTKVRQRLDDSPELAIELLAALIDIEDGEPKHQLELALMTSTSKEDGSLERWLVEQIEAGDSAGEYLKLLGGWGIESRGGLESVLGQLANNPDPTVISESMRALNTTLSRYPLALSPNQKKDISDQLRQYLNSSDENLRRTAVVSLSHYPQPDMAEILLSAFDDPSSKVRIGAVNSYRLKPFSSSEIHNRVITNLQDTSRSYVERVSLAGIALHSNLDLSEDERAIAEAVQNEADAYFSNLTEDERRVMTEEFQ